MLHCHELTDRVIAGLFAPYALTPVRIASGADIPGTYWGAPEAGLVDDRLYFRDDTPVHSLLHEGAHFICSTPERRRILHTDAGGDDLEECAVCYLQILLADRLPGVGRERLFADMDAWGYCFRLGSARAWFDTDGTDALEWLIREGIVHSDGCLRGVLRGAPS